MRKSFYLARGQAGIVAGSVLALSVFGPAFGPVFGLIGASAMAQTASVPTSQMDLPTSDAGKNLAEAMASLARNSRDSSALIKAGEAALELEDPHSAIGFFGRADDVSANNGRVKAGLGRSMLAMGQTVDALRLMEQAESLNYSDVPLLMDLGLARDLSGNQAGAQRNYQQALAREPNNETAKRRYAISLGISGQLDQAEAILEPMLLKQDRAAWRDRAFILAMNGQVKDAINITDTVMPRTLADGIRPYMERMSMLTPGQRAAAVHMGQFPAGLVNVRVASAATPAPAASPAPASAETSPGAGTAKSSKNNRTQTASRATRRAVRKETPKAMPAIAAASAPPRVAAVPSDSAAPSPALAAVPSAKAPPATATPAKDGAAADKVVVAANMAQPTVSPSSPPPSSPPTAMQRPPAAAAPSAGPVAPASIPASTPPAVPSSVPEPKAPVAAGAPVEATRSLADIMAEIEIPAEERRHDVVPVSLAELEAIRETKLKEREQAVAEEKQRKAAEAKEAARRKAEAEAKAKADAEKKRLADNPARYWVQIGVGRDKAALAFTLRQMKKQYDVLGKQNGWSAAFGRTNRLVVGPFTTLARAKAVEAEMKKAGSDAYVWRSDAGEEVDKVGG